MNTLIEVYLIGLVVYLAVVSATIQLIIAKVGIERLVISPFALVLNSIFWPITVIIALFNNVRRLFHD